MCPGDETVKWTARKLRASMTTETVQSDAGREPIEARMPISWSEGQGAPEWIMWMPGGRHEITATQRGKPRTLTVTVDRQTAATLQQTLRQHLDAGRQKPFLDFDHDRKAASAWPQEFAWRETPEPGVFCRVEWSKLGREAVEGRAYRSFSPTFYEAGGKVDGTPLCMGSLLNDPAFEKMAPIWSGRATPKESQPQKAITEQKTMIPNATEAAALQARIAELEAQNTELKAAADSKDAEEAVTAARAESEQLKTELGKLKEEVAARSRRDAEAIVASAVTRGVIPAKDEAEQKKWRELIIADPANADRLAKLPGRVALDGGKITRNPIVVTKADPNDILRGYIAAGTPREKGEVYRLEIEPIYAKGEQIDFRRFPVEAANVLGEVVGNIISQRTLSLLVSRRPMLRGVVTDFSDDRAVKGQTIYTRTVGLPTVQDFGGTVSETAVTDYPVTLSAHKEVKYGFTPAEYLTTNRNLVEEHAQAMAVALGNHLVDTVAALVTDAFTSETTGAAGDKDLSAITTAAKALNSAGVPDMDRSMWINPTFAEALENDELMLEYVNGNMAEAYGHWQNVKGFRDVWEYPALPANSVNLIGFAFHKNALLLATRVATDAEALAGTGYPGTLRVVMDPVTGFSVLSDRWIDGGTRKINTRLDVLYGVARGAVAAGHKFVTS